MPSLGDQIRGRGSVAARSAPERVEDCDHQLHLLTDGSLTVVHDQIFALDDIVEAYRRAGSGHTVGNIVVRP